MRRGFKLPPMRFGLNSGHFSPSGGTIGKNAERLAIDCFCDTGTRPNSLGHLLETEGTFAQQLSPNSDYNQLDAESLPQEGYRADLFTARGAGTRLNPYAEAHSAGSGRRRKRAGSRGAGPAAAIWGHVSGDARGGGTG